MLFGLNKRSNSTNYFSYLEKISNFAKYFRFLLSTSKIFCTFALLIQLLMDKENKNLNRIKVVLAEKNLQNKWLAEHIGRDQATISKWVTNSAQPNLETLVKIAQVLRVEIGELVRTDDVVKESNQ